MACRVGSKQLFSQGLLSGGLTTSLGDYLPPSIGMPHDARDPDNLGGDGKMLRASEIKGPGRMV